MPITINIVAETAAEAAHQLVGLQRSLVAELLKNTPAAAAAQSAVENAETVKQPPADTDTETKKAAEPEKKSRASKKETAAASAPAHSEAKSSEGGSAKTASPSDDAPAGATRADLKNLIAELYKAGGDDVLPEVQKKLQGFGANKQSEVKEEDLPKVVEQLEQLLKETTAKNDAASVAE